MEKYLIVTRDPRIPPDAEMFEYEVWSREDFIRGAESEAGIQIDGGIFYNIDSLDKQMYDALKSGIDIAITYYKFSDQNINLDFVIEEGLTTYEVLEPEPEPDVTPIPDPTPPPAPEPEPAIPEIKEEPPAPVREHLEPAKNIGDISVAYSNDEENDPNRLNALDLQNLLNYDDTNSIIGAGNQSTGKPAKVILFGSSKGGTGKTFTCLLSAYRYAKTHPNERIALADFDIIDGQVGITISKATPTLSDYYKQFMAGNKEFKYLSNSIVKSEKFNYNLDFYLAPPMDVPEVTNNFDFWQNVFELLITNYDTVFFDSGIDYLGKPPISRLYKIADKIILTSNTSINSVKSIVRQLQTISGKRKNNVFRVEDKILDKVNLVLTRVSSNNATNDLVVDTLAKYAPIVAAFGNIDDQISKTQWYQQWNIWDFETKVNEYLDRITSFE